jgi:hypothetical protein
VIDEFINHKAGAMEMAKRDIARAAENEKESEYGYIYSVSGPGK